MSKIPIDEALVRQALAALETAWSYDPDNADGYYFGAVTALRQALEQPAQPPPNCGTGYCSCIECLYEQPAPAQEPTVNDLLTVDQPAPPPAPDPDALTAAYMSGVYEGKKAERKRIVNLLMIQHEAAKGTHNYWNVAAQLIQSDVASDT